MAKRVEKAERPSAEPRVVGHGFCDSCDEPIHLNRHLSGFEIWIHDAGNFSCKPNWRDACANDDRVEGIYECER